MHIFHSWGIQYVWGNTFLLQCTECGVRHSSKEISESSNDKTNRLSQNFHHVYDNGLSWEQKEEWLNARPYTPVSIKILNCLERILLRLISTLIHFPSLYRCRTNRHLWFWNKKEEYWQCTRAKCDSVRVDRYHTMPGIYGTHGFTGSAKEYSRLKQRENFHREALEDLKARFGPDHHRYR